MMYMVNNCLRSYFKKFKWVYSFDKFKEDVFKFKFLN